MNEKEAKAELGDLIQRLGLREGDRVMLGIDMGKIPLPGYEAELSREGLRERRVKWCKFVLDVLLDHITPNGTLLVPSFSYSCSKPNSRFIREDTPSENGPFTEFFRSQPGVIRSLHPIFSLSGVGQDAEKLLGDVGRSAFGAMSPFSRFASEGVKFMCLGVELRDCITYGHHLEQTYGCPHRYNKAFKLAVLASGKLLSGEWYAYVGYRNLDYSADFSTLQLALSASGDLVEANWRGNTNHLVETNAVDRLGYELLRQDSSTFVDRDISFSFDDSEQQRNDDPNQTSLKITVG